MAAVSQPGSRAGLITALVIAIVLCLVAAAFMAVNMNENKEKEKRLADLQGKYNKIIRSGDLPTAGSELEEYTKDPANMGKSLYEVLKSQRDDLAKAATGHSSFISRGNQSTVDTMKFSADTVAKANQDLQKAGVSTPGAPLTNVVSTLAGAVLQKQQQIDTLKAQIDDLNKQLAAKDQARVQEAKAQQTKLTEALAKAEAATKESETYRQGKDTQLASLEKSMQTEIEAKSKTLDELNTQLKTRTDEMAKKDKEFKRLADKLNRLRPSSVPEVAMRRAAGKIIQVNRNNVVYINLGQGQAISPGMTFQIYDKVGGVPPVAEGSDEMPTGKGSIEVVRVSQGSSECRVVKSEPGAQIAEGDVIANLIYDPNIRWSFRVFGDFDLDQNNVATAAEADVVKRLVVQWGGRLMDQINMDTDFVVLGKEPVLPSYTKEQLAENPLLQYEMNKALAALKAYDDVKRQALELSVPVLSQNRFLYMIGYYDQAKK